MDKYFKGNQKYWNELTPVHERAAFYDVAGFKAGKSHLKSIELAEVGDVKGKSLLHLQCHFGLDTLSWARMGAEVTGADFSEKAIELARSLSNETGLKAHFILSNIYDLPELLKEQFDIVFTSYGILAWLPDLEAWAKIIAGFLKPGGFFYIVEGHPLSLVFDDSKDISELKVTNSYFHKPEPDKWEGEPSYTDKNAIISNPSYQWTHQISDVINAIISVGLDIEFIHEFPLAAYQQYPFLEKSPDGWYRLEGNKLPLTFSLKAFNK